MKLVNITRQTATVEVSSFDCFRLARMLETSTGDGSSVDVDFAEVYAAMFAAAGMAAQLEADDHVTHDRPQSLESMRVEYGPEDMPLTAD